MIYFEKSQPAPECLEQQKEKSQGDYKCEGVLEKLKADFKNKCYICEFKEPVTINVEHFRPHRGNKDLMFSWDNLFWSCSHCNNTKRDNFEDMIDCTDINEDIENRIKIIMLPFPKESVRIEALDERLSTNTTVELLNEVFNGTTKLKTIEASNLRNKVLREILEFQKCLLDYYEEGFEEDDKEYFLANIKRHLKKSSNFTSFKRGIIKENEAFKERFEQYFD
ncbi:hypothetical protein AWE51_00310 [Aquimarina aggregata]|uniref:HNH domain-containing protein n=1 Tax=Aquimarina aggregata TaxID=1642818 RepID=A0A162CTG7_9FLAO|nr:HNH endonuclease [Aquimarina aggregata]KZS41924.1 hypothetical protein AWE51_00310 [Aquimarina aggregata]